MCIKWTYDRKIIEKTNFKEVFVPPAPGDDGLSLGSAFYVNQIINKKILINQHLWELHILMNQFKEYWKRLTLNLFTLKI